jgi:bifunctional non-homologous end joining protein LigD
MLEEYHKKRDFARTTEPAGSSGSEPSKNKMTRLRFVVQKHDATRLHYDFRLESEDSVLKSWAVPKGISLDPKVKRLAVLTEDHPLDYLLFEGVIPPGNYGAGTVIVWDTGTFTSEQELVHQFNNGRITFTLFGHKLKGRFSIIKIKKYVPAKSSIVKTSRENQWLLIKANDQFASSEDLTVTKPESVLTRRVVSIRQNETGDRRQTDAMTITYNGHTKDDVSDEKKNATSITQFPINVKPMLATAVDEPFNDKRWVFEIKWDGVRSIFFWHKTKGIFKIQSRSGKDITHRYPELIRPLKSAVRCKESIILDGEIVVLDKDGTPSFQDHQRRMNVDDDREIEFLSQQMPANYYLFDVLYMDGKNLQALEFLQRRKIQSEVIDKNNRIQISDFIGEVGKEVFENVRKMNLEGMVAKYKSSKYLQGVRSRKWLKIKTMKTQDCVVIGYTRGEGNREGYFGSLLLAVNNNSNAVQLRFVGHTGSGFNFDQLGQIYNKLKEMKIGKRSVDHMPYVNRDPIWIKPDLVAEVKFSSWTSDKIMRSPIFLRFREDKSPAECIIEEEKMTGEIVQQRSADASSLPPSSPPSRQTTTANTTSSLKASTTYFSNLDKIFWSKSQNHPQLTKKDLIDYYDRISRYILPHLKNRPLSLSRYPDGIKGKHFYHKNWDQEKPDFVESIKIYSKSRGGVINYVMCNNKDTLLWLANLGCIEMHPWYSHVDDFNICKDPVLEDEEKCALDSPDFMVFDLDPYIYSGNENKGEEPEYNVKAFKATVQIAYALEDLFDTLNIKSCVKTSGKTGLHIFVPIGLSYSYEQTRSFTQIIGEILIKRHAQKITTAWSTVGRTGKVFFDHKQNAMGKTIASVFSARPTVSATVSMPVRWEDLSNILPTDFTILNTPDMLKKSGDQWNKILQNKQDIRKILEDVAQVKL